MADTKSSRGQEDSGLINLDALMGAGAAEPTPTPTPGVPLAAPLPAVLAAPPPPRRAAVVPSQPPPQPSLPAPLPPPVSVRRADDSLDGIASSKPLPPAVSVVPAPPAPLPPASVAGQFPAASADEPRSRRRLVPILLGIAAVLGIVAVAVHPWSTPPKTTAAAPPATATATPASTAAAVAKTTSSEPTGMDPNALPSADQVATPTPSAARPANAAAPATAATPKPEAMAKITEKDLGTMPSGDPGDLAGAMKSAVGPKDAPTEATKATDNANANQIRPAAGQVVGAIGAVLPAARACLGPDDSIRSGSLVFSSDGSVKQVSLSGGAKPTDDCIKSALSKAKLQPFSDDSFTTRVTVRP